MRDKEVIYQEDDNIDEEAIKKYMAMSQEELNKVMEEFEQAELKRIGKNK